MVLGRIVLLIALLMISLNASKKIGMYENQGSIIPLELEFINEYNQKTTLKNTIENKPKIGRAHV